MSGTRLTSLSSNWKQLKEKLDGEDKRPLQQTGIKRKRADGRQTVRHGLKRLKADDTVRLSSPGKRIRTMGNFFSSANPRVPETAETVTIPAHNATSTSRSSSSSVRRSVDVPNCGLHPHHKPGKYISLDCEMVGTGPPPCSDNLLARASLVNFHGELLYDSYVQPINGIEVTDFRTHVSGIQPHHLSPATARPFATVQADVAKLLEGKILVGHALRNDLRVLLLSHPRRDIRDTARYPKYRIDSRGRAPALRNLAKSELGLQIHTGEHSSIEDARVAMLLFEREKAGFEAENRKVFGNYTKVEKGRRSTRPDTIRHDGTDVDETDDDDGGSQDSGSERGVVRVNNTGDGHKSKSKKKKKKKRTKRK